MKLKGGGIVNIDYNTLLFDSVKNNKFPVRSNENSFKENIREVNVFTSLKIAIHVPAPSELITVSLNLSAILPEKNYEIDSEKYFKNRKNKSDKSRELYQLNSEYYIIIDTEGVEINDEFIQNKNESRNEFDELLKKEYIKFKKIMRPIITSMGYESPSFPKMK